MRLQPDRLAVLASGIAPRLLLRVNVSELGVRRAQPRIEPEGFLLFAHVPVQIAQSAQRPAEVVMVARHVRVEADRLTISRDLAGQDTGSIQSILLRGGPRRDAFGG